jgi:ribonucleoside-diphosphate reductase alpha chain
MKATVELAKVHGPYPTYKGSPLSEGKFQFDLWGVKPCDMWDWDALRKEVLEHGAYNSLLVACMPTASTSQIMGNNECIEPYTSNLYVRRTMSGDFIVANSHMIKDLQKLNLWSREMKDQIIAHNGSIQHIPGIPDDLKQLYKTAWELKQKVIIDLSVNRAPYVCQTQSLNLFFEEPTTRTLSSSAFYAWKKGLKTGSYYIRSRPKTQAQQFTIDPQLLKQLSTNKKPEVARVGQMKTVTTNSGQQLQVVCTDDICTMCQG